LKNWNLALLALQQIFCLHSRLVHAQWSLAPDKKICAAALPNSNFSNTFGIVFLQILFLSIIDGLLTFEDFMGLSAITHTSFIDAFRNPYSWPSHPDPRPPKLFSSSYSKAKEMIPLYPARWCLITSVKIPYQLQPGAVTQFLASIHRFLTPENFDKGFKSLKSAGYEIEWTTPNKEGEHMMILAAKKGNDGLVRFLHDKDKTLIKTGTPWGATALFIAAAYRNLSTVATLIELGADPSTAIISSKKLEFVAGEFFWRNPTPLCLKRATPLWAAAKIGQSVDIVKILMKHNGELGFTLDSLDDLSYEYMRRAHIELFKDRVFLGGKLNEALGEDFFNGETMNLILDYA
jgi:hypothetical protein